MSAPAMWYRGSPPRVRGKDGQHLADIGGRRITPACAGKRSASLMETVRLGDPPPRMRGKATGPAGSLRRCGITPACAGKSCPDGYTPCPARDHPRVCGEKHMEAWSEIYHEGSPPRMRGKAVGVAVAPVVTGITPAYAGKSLQCSKEFLRFWDHPRVCGEKFAT